MKDAESTNQPFLSSERRSRKSEVGSRKSEVGSRKSVQMASLVFPLFLTPLRHERSGGHGAVQLALLDERCWHGLVTASAARRARARPAFDEFLAFWRFGPDKGPSRRQWRLAQAGGKGGRGRY